MADAVVRRPRSTGKRSRALADERAQLACPVCLEHRLPHTVCGAGHLTCRPCAAKLSRCPICRGPLNAAFVPIRQLVDAVPGARLCRYYGTGCDRVKFDVEEEGEGHVEAECEFTSAPCPNAGCGRPVVLSRLATHVDAECAYRLVPCAHPGCDTVVPFHVVAEHRRACAHRVLACPFCDVGVAQGAMLGHFQDVHKLAPEVGVSDNAVMYLRFENSKAASCCLRRLTRDHDYMCVMVVPTTVLAVSIQIKAFSLYAHDASLLRVGGRGISARVYADGDIRSPLYLQFKTALDTTTVVRDYEMFDAFEGGRGARKALSLRWK